MGAGKETQAPAGALERWQHGATQSTGWMETGSLRETLSQSLEHMVRVCILEPKSRRLSCACQHPSAKDRAQGKFWFRFSCPCLSFLSEPQWAGDACFSWGDRAPLLRQKIKSLCRAGWGQ